MKFLAVVSAAALFAAASPSDVSVAYAGSLVLPMEEPIATAFQAKTGVRFVGEGKGSRALANLIRAGLRNPDVFISADPKLMKGIAPSYTVFGSGRMVVAYSTKSAHAAALTAAARSHSSILVALTAPGMRLGRTDPRVDPKGARTVRAIALLAKHYRDAAHAAALLKQTQEYPEEDLAVRVESGELDAGFFYSTEIVRPDLRVLELPTGTNLANEIAYAIAVMPRAPHPDAAKAFVTFLLTGGGRPILERAGLRYFARPRREHT